MKKINLLLIISFCFVIAINGQSKSKTNSQSFAPIRTVDSLLNVANKQLSQDDSLSIVTAKKALLLSKELCYWDGVALGYFIIGKAQEAMILLQEASASYGRALAEYQRLDDSVHLAEVLLSLGNASIYRGKLSESRSYLNQSLEISENINLDTTSFNILMRLAVVSAHAGDYEISLSYFDRASPLVKNKTQRFRMLKASIALQFNKGTLESQRDTILRALELSKQLNKHKSTASLYAHLGDIYFQMGETEQAAKQYFNIIPLAENHHLKAGEITAFISLSSLYNHLKEYQKALDFATKALQKSTEIKVPVYIANSHLQLGLSHLELAEVEDAENHFQQAQTEFENLESIQGIVECLIYLSKTYIKSKRYKESLLVLDYAENVFPEEFNIRAVDYYYQKGISLTYLNQAQAAIKYLNLSLNYAKESGAILSLINIYEALSNAHGKLNNSDKALSYLKTHNSLRDSLDQIEMNKKIQELTLKYEITQQKEQLKYFEKELIYQESKSALKSYYLIILLMVGSLGVIIIAWVWTRYKQRKEREELLLMNRQMELEKENLVAEQKIDFAHQKSRIFADLSHEFRTPLTLIKSPLQELIKESKNGEDMKKYKFMNRNANKLLDLIDQSLNVARSEDSLPTVEKKTYELNHFIKQILNSFIPLEESKKVEIVLDANLQKRFMVSFDWSLLEKALNNILINAFEHTPPDGRIKVQLSDINNKIAKITISDNGNGIPDEHLDFIFDRFYQVDSNRGVGSGVGLSHVQEIIDLHEGEIKVESLLGVGTKFTLLIPCITKSIHEVQKKVKPETDQYITTVDQSKDRIFIIDDNEQMREYLKDVFLKFYQVHTFEDPYELLIESATLQPDLIISDVIMSIMDGHELINQLKSNIKTSHIPIILVTAKCNKDDEVEGLKTGADDYITKPFSVEILQLKVRNLINRRKELSQSYTSSPYFQVQKISTNEIDSIFLQHCKTVVERYIDDESFGVEDFSREMGMSRSSLYKKVKSLTNTNLISYIRIIKLRRAVELLQLDQYNIIEIAYKVGFQSRQSFNKAFKLQFGMTPSEYRKSLRQ